MTGIRDSGTFCFIYTNSPILTKVQKSVCWEHTSRTQLVLATLYIRCIGCAEVPSRSYWFLYYSVYDGVLELGNCWYYP